MTDFMVRRQHRRAANHFNSPNQLTDGNGDTALDEAESGFTSWGAASLIISLRREMRFLPRRINLRVISQA
jgi:hypothetical protein